MGFLDIKINFLEQFLDIKRAFLYLYKNQNKPEFYHNINFNIESQQLLADLLDELDIQPGKNKMSGYTLYIHDMDYINSHPETKMYFDKILTLKGIVYKKSLIEKDMFLDVVINAYIYFLLLNDIKKTNSQLIQKKQNTLITYSLWCEENDLLTKWDEVVLFFLKYFRIYINNLDIFMLKKNNLLLNSLNNKLEKISSIIYLNIELVFTLIEFKDGIYDMKTNKFRKKDKMSSKLLDEYKKIATFKYCNYLFKNLKIPKIWLTNILKVLKYEKEQVLDLFNHLSVIFSTNYDNLKKKRVLFILGESNTLKTSLIADIFVEFFGINNVAFITQSKTFPFQHFENKLIAVLDEFKYYESLHPEYLKLFENRSAVVEKKFRDAIVINPLHIIIISNENFIENQKDCDKKKALENRVNTFIFVKDFVNDTDMKIKEDIKKENIEIVIMLCKFYAEFIKNTQNKKTKKITNLINKLTNTTKQIEKKSNILL